MNQITESLANPAASVPIVAFVGTANWVSSLPTIINVLTAFYLFLLVSHKGYVIWKEWKTKTIIKD